MNVQKILNAVAIVLIILVLEVSLALVFFGPKIRLLVDGSRSSSSGGPSPVTVQKVVDEESATIAAVEKVSPAVVSIVEDSVVLDPFSGPYRQSQGIGTGFTIGGDGLIVTNRHVVSDTSATYTVVLKDGNKTYKVSKVYRDPVMDLAFLKVDATNLPAVELGDSSSLRVGQTVIAIGNALGRFDNTVTEGVVSALGRGIEAGSPLGGGAESLDNVIQTDAALNPGNSGGPLINLSGQVIGINVAISSSSQNIGFSVPINIIKPVLLGFEQTGRIIRPYLGVSYYEINEATSFLQKLPQGVYVSSVVSNSPAEKAGVRVGDIITKIDAISLDSKNPLIKVINERKVGDTVTLTIDRSGSTVTLKATLAEAPAQ